jgi:hypothetical protein
MAANARQGKATVFLAHRRAARRAYRKKVPVSSASRPQAEEGEKKQARRRG